MLEKTEGKRKEAEKMARWHQRLGGREFEQTRGDGGTEEPAAAQGVEKSRTGPSN